MTSCEVNAHSVKQASHHGFVWLAATKLIFAETLPQPEPRFHASLLWLGGRGVHCDIVTSLPLGDLAAKCAAASGISSATPALAGRKRGKLHYCMKTNFSRSFHIFVLLSCEWYKRTTTNSVCQALPVWFNFEIDVPVPRTKPDETIFIFPTWEEKSSSLFDRGLIWSRNPPSSTFLYTAVQNYVSPDARSTHLSSTRRATSRKTTRIITNFFILGCECKQWLRAAFLWYLDRSNQGKKKWFISHGFQKSSASGLVGVWTEQLLDVHKIQSASELKSALKYGSWPYSLSIRFVILTSGKSL